MTRKEREEVHNKEYKDTVTDHRIRVKGSHPPDQTNLVIHQSLPYSKDRILPLVLLCAWHQVAASTYAHGG
jgi:hypothetical protein